MPTAIHLSTTVSRNSFGVGAVAFNLARTQLRYGWDTYIWSLDRMTDVTLQPEMNGYPLERVRTFEQAGPRMLGWSNRLHTAISSIQQPADCIVHQHGIWTGVSAARSWGTRRRGASVITLHGFLSPWALRRSRWKKRLALAAYERSNLRNAACLHALSEPEAQQFREFGLDNPIAVIPNGISAEWLCSTGDAQRFRDRFAIASGSRILLFLSRITPQKGLPMLIETIKAHSENFAGWNLLIAGVDEFDHQRELETLVDRYGLGHSIRFIGPLYEQTKRDAFSAADAFILPSLSEGWPMVVLEALGAGVPVFTTTAVPFPQLLQHRAGWVVEPSVESIEASLPDLLSRSATELHEMGRRGQALVANQFTWDNAASQLVAVYAWLLGQGPQPDCVTTFRNRTPVENS
jgi:glycosyltransferase involved in cell wall biosynthesis